MTLELSVSAARSRLAEALDEARISHNPVFLTRHGRRVGVLSGIAEWDALVGEAARVPSGCDSERLLAQIERLAERASALVRPGTPPLEDVSALYETRAPRL